MDKNYKYYAFISYSRQDEEWAMWLQHELENYHLPDTLKNREDLPKEFRPVFRDIDELKAGNLPDQIYEALKSSANLIVICSPRAVKSKWVNKEINDFIEIGNEKGVNNYERIFPFIVEGAPDAQQEAQECFPKALRDFPEEKNLLGSNVNENGRDRAFVKVMAGMLPNIGFDALWNRYEYEKAEAQRKKRNRITTAIVAGFLVMAGLTFWMYTQRQQTLKANWQMMENRSRFVAEKAQSLVDANDSYLAMRLLLEVLPKDLEHPEIPYTPEAEGAFRNAFAQDNATLKGHDDVVFSAAFSPDGNTVVSTSRDGKIILWDVHTGQPVQTIDMEGGLVIRADFSPDGKQLVISMGKGKVLLLDVFTGKKIYEWNDCVGMVFCVQFSPDGKRIVAGSETVAKVYDVETKQTVWTSDTINSWYKSAYFSSDGKRVITSSHDETIKIWNAEDGTPMDTIITPFWLNDAVFSHDDELIAYAPWDDSAAIIDLSTGEVYGEYGKHPEYVNSVDFSPDRLLLLTTSENTVKLWNVDFEEEIRTLNCHSSVVNRAVFSPDGKHVVSASDDKTVKIWNTDAREQHQDVDTNSCDWVEYSPDGELILVSGSDGLRIWNVESDTVVLSLKEQNQEASCATFSPDGSRIAIVFNDKWFFGPSNIVMLDFPSLITTTVFNQDDQIEMVNFSPDGNQLVVVSSLSKDVLVLDPESGSVIQILTGHQSLVKSAVFSSDGKHVVTAAWDYTVKVWDVETGEPLLTLDKHLNDVNDAVFSPNGRLIASGSTDMTVRIWDALTGEELYVLPKHTDDVRCLAFSPDGSLLASGSDDNTIKIWDVKTGTLLHTINTSSLYDEDTPRHIVFNHEGNQIISASVSGATIWSFPPLQELIDQTRERFKDRPLTLEERRMYYLE